MKKAVFAGEYFSEETVKRPLVTVNRTGSLFRDEKDMICCGMCGSIMNYKAKFCMGCGAKFKFIKSPSEYEKYKEETEIKQLSLFDLQEGEA